MLVNPFRLSRTRLIHLVTLLLLLFYNFSLYQHFFAVYPPSLKHVVYLLSFVLILAAFIEIFLHMLCVGRATKPVLISLLVMSAMASYFMDSYNVVLDTTMIGNIFETDTREAGDLFSLKLIVYVILLGLLPSLYVYKVNIIDTPFHRELRDKLKIGALALLVIVSQVVLFGKFYSSFFREHKDVRYYSNPLTYIYASTAYLFSKFETGGEAVATMGVDAKISESDGERELIVLVVGETARADKFSLNAYERKTNPLLEKEQVYSFSNVRSCGTSTAYSVPCMFSFMGSDDFSESKARGSENLLDVLQHSSANILWRDNNSNSKGVALRVPYEDFRTTKNNPVCDVECRDMGMLSGLQAYIDSKKQGDIVIVLHQMGNHGPAYYKRYPAEFERFTPACKTSQLEECTLEEITNAYDNAILYTDYFLSEIIKLLKQNASRYETAMVYVSDHGESLGENGVYLHGLPNFMAPEEQRKVGAVFWFAANNHDINKDTLAAKLDNPFTHDNLFHTLLGLLEVRTDLYDPELDILDHQAP